MDLIVQASFHVEGFWGWTNRYIHAYANIHTDIATGEEQPGVKQPNLF